MACQTHECVNRSALWHLFRSAKRRTIAPNPGKAGCTTMGRTDLHCLRGWDPAIHPADQLRQSYWGNRPVFDLLDLKACAGPAHGPQVWNGDVRSMFVEIAVPDAEDVADSSRARRANPGGSVFDHYALLYRDA